MRVGSSWDTLYAVYRTAEKYSEANEAVSRGLEIFNELVVQHPTAAKYPVLAMEACMKWMDVQIRQGQLLEAANSMRRRAELVENWRNTTDAGTQDFEAAKHWSMNTEGILTLAALGVDAIDEKQDIDPGYGVCFQSTCSLRHRKTRRSTHGVNDMRKPKALPSKRS